MRSILIANRGEIACRIIRTCKKLGIKAIAVYSDADENSLHVRNADESIRLGPSEAKESYLSIEKILRAAKKSRAQAVHPGYGFLSENSQFASALEDAEITFIGPTPKNIELMGDKIGAKKLAQSLRVPTVPGITVKTRSKDSVREIKDFIKRYKLPVLVKAAAGGGGRGMRIIENVGDIEECLESAEREAKAFFGDGRLFIEKLILEPRHVEVQILGDNKGDVVHFFDRDCTAQRRHQKVIEEAPALNIPSSVRERILDSAVALGKASKYRNAGTVEFLLDREFNFYFLEVNSRLQVEHPVTESIVGLDLVELQIKVAQGEKLKDILKATKIPPINQVAIECRICAEDPDKDFVASTGKIEVLDFTALDSAYRLDTGFQSGDLITHYYDSLLAKLIVTAPTRAEAISKMEAGLLNSSICGIRTNIDFLLTILRSDEFKKGTHHIRFAETLLERQDPAKPAILGAALYCIQAMALETGQDPWANHDLFRISQGPLITRSFLVNGHAVSIGIRKGLTKTEWKFSGTTFGKNVDLGLSKFERVSAHEIQVVHEAHNIRARVYNLKSGCWIESSSGTFEVQESPSPLKKTAEAEGKSTVIRSPLPGKVISVKARIGEQVKSGDVIFVLESMKMEHMIKAPKGASISEILTKTGDVVEANKILARLG